VTEVISSTTRVLVSTIIAVRTFSSVSCLGLHILMM